MDAMARAGKAKARSMDSIQVSQVHCFPRGISRILDRKRNSWDSKDCFIMGWQHHRLQWPTWLYTLHQPVNVNCKICCTKINLYFNSIYPKAF